MFKATVAFSDGSIKDINLLTFEENGIKTLTLKKDALDFIKTYNNSEKMDEIINFYFK